MQKDEEVERPKTSDNSTEENGEQNAEEGEEEHPDDDDKEKRKLVYQFTFRREVAILVLSCKSINHVSSSHCALQR